MQYSLGQDDLSMKVIFMKIWWNKKYEMSLKEICYWISNEATARLRNYLKNSFAVRLCYKHFKVFLKKKTKLNVGDSGFQQAYTN